MTQPQFTAPLEQLWAGEFGNDYIERNRDADNGRSAFWTRQVKDLGIGSALEVGCNIGGNLVHVAELLGSESVAGVDVNEKALDIIRDRIPGIDARHSPGGSLPFEDGQFELGFTMGVLIHQDPATQLEPMMSEIVRCSSRFVIAGEYFADEPTQVPYRGQDRALFKRDFGALYLRLFPQLGLVARGNLGEEDGHWDDLTYWVFSKPSG